jgi:hypothetical protein
MKPTESDPRYGRTRQMVTAGVPILDEMGQLIDELEPVNDEWLERFATAAEPFIEAKQAALAEAYDAQKRAKKRARAMRGRTWRHKETHER